MKTKPGFLLAAFSLVLAALLIAGAGFAPVFVNAQGENPTETTPQSPTEITPQLPTETTPQLPVETEQLLPTEPEPQLPAEETPQPPAQSDPAGGDESSDESAALAADLAGYPGAAAYDSGWRAINPGQTLLLTHNLSFGPDAYVVDLRFLSTNPTLENHGYNQLGYGGNQLVNPVPAGYAVDDLVGAYWHSLTATTIKVYRLPQDKNYASKIRVRIWVVTQTDYDSGWLNISPDSVITPGFAIAGGVADNYLVNLEFKDTGAGLGIHHRYYGGASLAGSNDRVGAYWRNLTNTSIQVYRRASEPYADQVRVRIWNQPRPTYDSGWVNGNLGTYVNLAHNIGGNPDDYIVDLQFKDPNDFMGVNVRCYGGCDLRTLDTPYEYTKQGAYWRNLTSTGIEVGRRANDVFADQVRVRIWNAWTPAQPAYDSGWKTTSPGGISPVFHHLGGDVDDYLVNFVYNDTSWKVSQLYYGVKTFGSNPPVGYSADQNAGAYWRSLTTSSVVVFRAPNDQTVDKWRLRIWRMPKPDYDSGWYTLAAGSSHLFDHGLTGDRADFLVDVSFNDLGSSGKNQRYLGGMVTNTDEYHGAFWNNFSTEAGDTLLTVYRFPNDLYADQVRVRIWRVNTPDYKSGYLAFTPGQTSTFHHNLKVSPEDMLVDVTARQSSGDHKVFYGRVDIGAGGHFPTYVENDRAGFYWYFLTNRDISVQRLPEDDNALSINVRIWTWPVTIYLPEIQK